MDRPKRNPKRKAPEAADAAAHQCEDEELLKRACSSLTLQDIEDWQGWIELESEPAFFNSMLRNLGVRDVKVQELFTMDLESLQAVSKPVFGLIFLFQYGPDQEEEEEQYHESNANLWFANQTTNNACATVALLNIIMNTPDIELGQRLAEFKDATKNLDTPLRGHRVSSSKFIRTIHNSFTRRIDHLNADLCLQNAHDDASSKAKRKGANKGRKRNSKKGKAHVEYGYHFIAYVPYDGLVWELDGLRSKPHEIGLANGKDWTVAAKPQIEARMLQYEGSQLSFNLLAVCRRSFCHLSEVIATLAAALRIIQSRMKDDAMFTNKIVADELLLDINNDAQLAEFNLCKEDIDNATLPPRLNAVLSYPEWETKETYDMYQSFRAQLKSVMVDFRTEMLFTEIEDERVKSRKRDYVGALHCWTKKLAEKGVLEDIIRMSS